MIPNFYPYNIITFTLRCFLQLHRTPSCLLFIPVYPALYCCPYPLSFFSFVLFQYHFFPSFILSSLILSFFHPSFSLTSCFFSVALSGGQDIDPTEPKSLDNSGSSWTQTTLQVLNRPPFSFLLFCTKPSSSSHFHFNFFIDLCICSFHLISHFLLYIL